MRVRRTFPPVPASTRAARRFVLRSIGDALAGQRDAVAVIVGELAMNAVEHARSEFDVSVELTGGRLRVEVVDRGGGFPAAGPMPPPGSPRGRGLPIVAGLADAWGTIGSPDSAEKGVWFLVTAPTRPAPAGDSRTAAKTRTCPARSAERPRTGR